MRGARLRSAILPVELTGMAGVSSSLNAAIAAQLRLDLADAVSLPMRRTIAVLCPPSGTYWDGRR